MPDERWTYGHKQERNACDMQDGQQPYKRIVFVCTNQREPGERVCCADGHGDAIRDQLKALVKERGLRGRVRVCKSGCMDRCEEGPNVMVFPGDVWLRGVQETDVPAIMQRLEDELRAENALPRGYDERRPAAPS
jgi:(2Fe-2S) ferredoxin/ubiquitin